MTRQPDSPWRDIGEAEQAARDKAVAKENKTAAAMRTLVRTRARQLADEPPPPDRQVAQDALRDAATRQAWAAHHRAMAEQHRRTLADLIAHHEEQAERLMR